MVGVHLRIIIHRVLYSVELLNLFKIWQHNGLIFIFVEPKYEFSRQKLN